MPTQSTAVPETDANADADADGGGDGAAPIAPDPADTYHVHGQMVGEQKMDSDYGDDDTDSNDSTTVQHDTTPQIV